MRKVLIIALGLASLGARRHAAGDCGAWFLQATAADAARNCTYNPKTGQKVCTFSKLVTTPLIIHALRPKRPRSANPKL